MTCNKNQIILHAEDEPAHAAIIRLAFERHVGDVQLMQVDDGKVALDYLYRRKAYVEPSMSLRPDLILLDLHMPRIGGLEVLSIVKKDPELRSIPVVVLTTSDLPNDRSAAHSYGADDYLVKPNHIDMFVLMMSKLCATWL
jgi:CheY-like chemotaxis protein